jgi:hypothetical protein
MKELNVHLFISEIRPQFHSKEIRLANVQTPMKTLAPALFAVVLFVAATFSARAGTEMTPVQPAPQPDQTQAPPPPAYYYPAPYYYYAPPPPVVYYPAPYYYRPYGYYYGPRAYFGGYYGRGFRGGFYGPRIGFGLRIR